MDNILMPFLLSLFAGLSTVIGGLIILVIKNPKKSKMSFFLGMSAGAMIYISFMELLPESIKTLGFLNANIVFFFGIAFIGIIDRVIPHHYEAFCTRKGVPYNKLLLTGYMMALGIMIHNFPEGIAVFMSSLGNLRFGTLIAFATAMHNIPEGIAVATPIYFATKSKLKAFQYSFLAGIAEPVGAILAYVVLRPFINPVFLSYVFACIAGIMVYLSFDELLPSCFENNEGHTAIVGIVFGMLIMVASLYFI